MSEALVPPNDDAEDRAWQLYQYWLGRDDPDYFKHVYLGHYASRAEFGNHLLEETYAANDRLQRLPPELRPYVRWDAEAVVQDWVDAGHFIVMPDATEPGNEGVLVFDAHGIGALDHADRDRSEHLTN